MADIRINALATTAASTASDDFIAVDGSANGTRKLNAYSPTFGGNLTVSGTGASSFAGPVTFASGGDNIKLTRSAFSSWQFGIGTVNSINGLHITDTTGNTTPISIAQGAPDASLKIAATTGATTLAGNLTVSGTGTSSVAGNLGVGTTSVGSSRKAILVSDAAEGYLLSELRTAVAANYYFDNGQGKYLGNGYAAFAECDGSTGNFNWSGAGNNSSGAGASLSLSVLMRLTQSGNLLVGTTTDGGQKLQVSGTGYFSGSVGIGASPLTPLHVKGAVVSNRGVLMVQDSSGSGANSYPVISLYDSADSERGSVGLYGNDFKVINKISGNLILATNNTTALTLDSSQNATFAGKVTVQGTAASTYSGTINVTKAGGGKLLGLSSTDGNSPYLNIGDGVAYGINFGIDSSDSSFPGLINSTDGGIKIQTNSVTRLSIAASTGNATFTGAIAIGNTVQTAVSVASTHKVTISIGGSTYYLLATNV